MLRFVSFCLLLGFSTLALAHETETKSSTKTAKSDGLKKVLLFSGTGWYRHPEIPSLNGWLVRLGAENGIEVDVSETGADITPEKLAGYQVVLLNNANMLDKVLDAKQRDALQAWYQKGGGIVA